MHWCAVSGFPYAVKDLAFNLEVALKVLQLSRLEQLFGHQQKVAIVYFIAKLLLNVVPNGLSERSPVIRGLAKRHSYNVEVPVNF